MTDLQKAKEIAMARCPIADCYTEYEDAFFFYSDGVVSAGGNTSVVVLKTGEVIPSYEYFMSGKYECKEIEKGGL